MKVLYGTTNPAKLSSMRKITSPLGLELVGLNDLNKPLPLIEESGNNPLENAKLKAKSYFRAFGLPVFSCDSGLYFDGVNEFLQPGVNVRRVKGKELSDDEMIAYYGGLAKQFNDSLTARYRNAICFIIDENTVFTSMDISLGTEPFLLVSKPHKKRVEGFPLDSLSVDIKTNKYYYDITYKSLALEKLDEGFRKFFIEALKGKTCL